MHLDEELGSVLDLVGQDVTDYRLAGLSKELSGDPHHNIEEVRLAARLWPGGDADECDSSGCWKNLEPALPIPKAVDDLLFHVGDLGHDRTESHQCWWVKLWLYFEEALQVVRDCTKDNWALLSMPDHHVAGSAEQRSHLLALMVVIDSQELLLRWTSTDPTDAVLPLQHRFVLVRRDSIGSPQIPVSLPLLLRKSCFWSTWFWRLGRSTLPSTDRFAELAPRLDTLSLGSAAPSVFAEVGEKLGLLALGADFLLHASTYHVV